MRACPHGAPNTEGRDMPDALIAFDPVDHEEAAVRGHDTQNHLD